MGIKKAKLLSLACILSLAIAGCSSNNGANGTNDGNGGNASPAPAAEATAAVPAALTKIKVALDWTPNTNHTGLYAAKELGYYEEEGLDVEIVQPGAAGADTMVTSGEAAFGISAQEALTLARLQGVPLVSIAAIIQHNTSGFAAPKDRNITSPKDFEGKTYGGWGSPAEEAAMKAIMDPEGGDVKKVKLVNIGEADYFTAVKRDIDFAWIFYAWTGIEAELRGEPLDMLYLKDYAPQLDYYTPILTTSEKVIAEQPELVKAFLKATSKGYQYAIDQPEEAAAILTKAVPDLDPELVLASQKWLSPKYTDDAARWGEQKAEVWQNYSDWMYGLKLLDQPLDVDSTFTNEFLPAE
ncbi:MULTISPECIES: ABC transporter substrate-binding protein [unclassified Paenibacillus]|uniref:ABC transporter substrate-binding protein n=1 Tax=unclassified Paenibacillus TaxID=185978 RepID=UPI002406DFEA|nr:MULTISPECIES: ABC transporter substrate-binding protein [unclassified Paenibacillus]MDF9840943.1 ABC-type nitrate/sulfonate/bicarbonate transport system substrate-binding protein [Paenibacillus sp. PastF-2]MDF9847527.1 ABC-type nitrate/sulfonate/bicarbonate transport system substrate-binding protein [Paenibacillus sp. PastM-2]MDF9853897.1 ABC-type nitrate/sulfonate/bicarbonate transport system substrate-binding protein [Paenibacillus sp. PastF-1]MDH6479168.1 ABC-type nitrate/sulfonate/bicarb